MATESSILKALKALKTHECPSIAVAARKYSIPYRTLYDCYRRKASRRYYAHTSQMALNKAQEDAVVRWVGALTTKSFPPVYPLLRARIEVVRKLENPEAPLLGKNYLTRFINRYLELRATISNR